MKYTVVWTTKDTHSILSGVWTVSRVRNVENVEEAIEAIQRNRNDLYPAFVCIAIFEGWPEQAEDAYV